MSDSQDTTVTVTTIESHFKPGALVLTKIKGFPEWPSRVIPFDLLPEKIQHIKPKSLKKGKPKSKKAPKDTEPLEIICVKFYGDDEYIWCSNKDLKPLDYEGIDEFLIKKGEIPDKDGNYVGKKSAKPNRVTNAFLIARNKELSFEDFASFGSHGKPPTPEPVPEEPEIIAEEEEIEVVKVEDVDSNDDDYEEGVTKKKRKYKAKPGPKPKRARTESGEAADAASTEVKKRPGPKPKAKPGPKAKAKPGPKPKQKPGPKQKQKPGPKPKQKPGPKPKGKPGPKPKVKEQVKNEVEGEEPEYELSSEVEEEEEEEEEGESDWGLDSDAEDDEHLVDRESIPKSEVLADKERKCTKAYVDLRIKIQNVIIQAPIAVEGEGNAEQEQGPNYKAVSKELDPLITKLLALKDQSRSMLKSTNLAKLLIIVLKKPEFQSAKFIKSLRNFIAEQLDYKVEVDNRQTDGYKEEPSEIVEEENGFAADSGTNGAASTPGPTPIPEANGV